ncbi:unnamed protein product [Pleuronectes platessa]|uniref:G-protein coupled receptors family 1 profile domain-containing protein n=1 Tax=Pleuronectes platessa TaxID=8262 RepID=A0A9N7YBW6_PLEPL|nr:unnamed protein product [Pleuronectes platessa]
MLLFNLTPPVAGAVLRLSVDFNSPVDYLIFIFQILFATAAVLLAGPVVISILCSRALRLQNRFIFMLNTSICDTLVGLSVYYQGLFDVQEGYPSRNGTYNVLTTLLGVNIMTFLFAQFDRYFAVCHSFGYMRFVTRRVIISTNVYCWFHVYVLLLIQNFLPLSKAVQMYQLERDPPSAERENNKESLRIIIFVVISFLVLWVPSFVNIVLRLIVGRGLVFRNEATNLFAIMARLNAVCTPAVYLWGSPALREATVRTVWGRVCPRCRRRVVPSPVKGTSKGRPTKIH